MLAAQLVKDQGIYVEGLNFFTGFCVEGHTHAIRKNKKVALAHFDYDTKNDSPNQQRFLNTTS